MEHPEEEIFKNTTHTHTERERERERNGHFLKTNLIDSGNLLTLINLNFKPFQEKEIIHLIIYFIY